MDGGRANVPATAESAAQRSQKLTILQFDKHDNVGAVGRTRQLSRKELLDEVREGARAASSRPAPLPARASRPSTPHRPPETFNSMGFGLPVRLAWVSLLYSAS